VTFTRLRDAGAERLTDAGARLLGVVVATPGGGFGLGVHGAGRRCSFGDGVVPAIEHDLAGGLD